MKLKNIVHHPRFRFWTDRLHRGFGFIWHIGQYDISGSVTKAQTRLRKHSHKLFTWFHFYCYIYVCVHVIMMASRGETEKSINWGLIAILIKPTEDENKIIGK